MRLDVLSLLAAVTLASCEAQPTAEQAGLTSITASSSNATVKRSANCGGPKGTAEFETNLALENFCITYHERQDGTIDFFFKGTNEKSANVALAVPHTDSGYVWDYDTQIVLSKFKDRADRCDMLLSTSDYPPVTISGSDGTKDYKVSSTACSKEGKFSVQINAIKVAKLSGESWNYEVSARYLPENNADQLFVKGRFEVEKQ